MDLLHKAVKSGNKHMVQLLLDRGAEPNKVDCMRGTPLCRALWLDRKIIANLLKDNGAMEAN